MAGIVVTAGEAIADIDVLACAVAYAELLNLEGKTAEAVIPGPLNNSIPPIVRGWRYEFLRTPTDPDSDVVIVDVSERRYFAKFVKDARIIEIYDHRFGFKEEWDKKLGESSHIEPVGACATLIWEQFVKRGFADQISETSSRLLYAAILSNTLDFKVHITDGRDLAAFDALSKKANLGPGFISSYFNEVDREASLNPGDAIKNDTKTIDIPGFGYTIVMAQLELWNAQGFLEKNKGILKSTLMAFGREEWIASLPSISEGKNYIYTENSKLKELIQKALPMTFRDDVGVTEELWLRKEIREKLLRLR